MLRRRPILLAMLALAVPLPALAMSGEPGDPGPADLGVSTSLAGCGLAGSELVCQLDVSYNTLAEADSYTASVTRADGSVIDYGAVPAGGTSLHVPYVGAGAYSVRVTAYGAPEEPGEEAEEIATDVSGAEPEEDEGRLEAGDAQAEVEVDADAEGRGPAEPELDNGETAEAAVEAEAVCDEAAQGAIDAVPPEPVEPPEDLDPANPDEDADGRPDAAQQIEYERLVAEREAALEAAEAAAAGC